MTSQNTVAEELRARLSYLSDPNVEWVNRAPRKPTESCLLFDHAFDSTYGDHTVCMAIFGPTMPFLSDFVFRHYGLGGPVEFNDQARSREDVLLLLKEAVVEAERLGL